MISPPSNRTRYQIANDFWLCEQNLMYSVSGQTNVGDMSFNSKLY